MSDLLETLKLIKLGADWSDFALKKIDDVEKAIKALEIIVDREVNIQAFRKHNYKTYEDYKRLTNLHENSTPLTEEEFYSVQEELLKEVFENDRG